MSARSPRTAPRRPRRLVESPRQFSRRSPSLLLGSILGVPLEGLDVEIVRGDVREVATLRSAFEGADVVFHLAGLVSITAGHESSLTQTNVEGTRHVVEACVAAGVPLVVSFRPHWWLTIELQLDDKYDVPAEPATRRVNRDRRAAGSEKPIRGWRMV